MEYNEINLCEDDFSLTKLFLFVKERWKDENGDENREGDEK